MKAWLDSIGTFLQRSCLADELSERLELDGAPEELVPVIEGLNALFDKLWVSGFQIGAKQEMLEKLVEIRTNEVHEILNNVRTGFLLTLRDETVLDNYSRACLTIFGKPDIKGAKLSDLMGLSGSARQHFSLCYEQIFDAFLPTEVSIGQLPKEFVLGGRHYAISAAPIQAPDGQLVRLFFSINDTTEMRKLAHENTLRQALIHIVGQKDAFAAFLRETSRSLATARSSPSQPRLRAHLHTLKGNLGCFGLHDLAQLIHSMEDSAEITLRHVQTVEDELCRFLQTHHAVIGLDYPAPEGGFPSAVVEQVRGLLESLVFQDKATVRRALVDQFYGQASWVRAEVLLSPLRGLFDRVAERLEKRAELVLSGQDMLVDPERLGAVFSSLGHLVRNSLDHGIESPGERGHKSEVGHVTIACHETLEAWFIEVSDDGGGIDTDTLARNMVGKNRISAEAVATMTTADRLRLIFENGLSTKESATLESGRGVGMGAILAAVEASHGEVSVRSVRGEGTQITLRIPKRPANAPRTIAGRR